LFGGSEGKLKKYMRLTTALDIDNKKIVYDGCMVTYSGVIVDLFNPKADVICLEDIAHGLAFTCRWNGATKSYFSVAEHCCMMYDRVEPELKATALFHDCEEAYWGDIIKPLKNLLPEDIKVKMRLIRNIIFLKYKIPFIAEEIEAEDFALLQWDLSNLILSNNHTGMDCYNAEKEWLIRAYELNLQP
jgi:hypothetical protein